MLLPDSSHVLLDHHSPHLLRASQYLYAKRNQSSLPWDVRGPKIVDRLTETQADVIMLQEVETDAFKDLFVARLEPAGYGFAYPLV